MISASTTYNFNTNISHPQAAKMCAINQLHHEHLKGIIANQLHVYVKCSPTISVNCCEVQKHPLVTHTWRVRIPDLDSSGWNPAHQSSCSAQQVQLQSHDTRHHTASKHYHLPPLTHDVFKVCFTYLHPVDAARAMTSNKALLSLSKQLLCMGHARHAARRLLVTAVQGAAALQQQCCSTCSGQQSSCSEYSQQQCVQAVTWLLKTAGPEIVWHQAPQPARRAPAAPAEVTKMPDQVLLAALSSM
ncbi:hypothetical protein COO60DRAFT_857582 [Scenedesmus sp. NREL 46B-D3]|nr:hypothetical protein COO60DRAFT_857582 [Scenedesmus sp. NREL 46B-D3]